MTAGRLRLVASAGFAATGCLLMLVLGSGPSRAASVEPCSGPRPISPNSEQVTTVLREGQRSPGLFGLNCVPAADTVSSSPIDWGDGTTTAATVSYGVNTDGDTKQAWVTGPHAYERATCPDGTACSHVLRISATVTEDQTGERFPLLARVVVTPAAGEGAWRPLRTRVGHRVHRVLAVLRTPGTRSRHELSATIDWADGTTSRGRVLGRRHRFVIIGSHRWSSAGQPWVVVTVTDRFSGITTRIEGRAVVRDRRVSR